MSKLQDLNILLTENNNSIQRLNKLVSTPVYINSSNNIDSSNVIKGNNGTEIIREEIEKMDYIVKVHRRTELSDKVSGAMDKIFLNLNSPKLVIVENIAILDAPKRFTQSQIRKMEREFTAEAKKDYLPDIVDKVEIKVA